MFFDSPYFMDVPTASGMLRSFQLLLYSALPVSGIVNYQLMRLKSL